ncbi:hypothetical protein JW930_07470 [Candidatus Woesearchaeota archaeon]|nr:hypothetical protein [Candidatus Woesearchaeota archaeon]
MVRVQRIGNVKIHFDQSHKTKPRIEPIKPWGPPAKYSTGEIGFEGKVHNVTWRYHWAIILRPKENPELREFAVNSRLLSPLGTGPEVKEIKAAIDVTTPGVYVVHWVLFDKEDKIMNENIEETQLTVVNKGFRVKITRPQPGTYKMSEFMRHVSVFTGEIVGGPGNRKYHCHWSIIHNNHQYPVSSQVKEGPGPIESKKLKSHIYNILENGKNEIRLVCEHIDEGNLHLRNQAIVDINIEPGIDDANIIQELNRDFKNYSDTIPAYFRALNEFKNELLKAERLETVLKELQHNEKMAVVESTVRIMQDWQQIEQHLQALRDKLHIDTRYYNHLVDFFKTIEQNRLPNTTETKQAIDELERIARILKMTRSLFQQTIREDIDIENKLARIVNGLNRGIDEKKVENEIYQLKSNPSYHMNQDVRQLVQALLGFTGNQKNQLRTYGKIFDDLYNTIGHMTDRLRKLLVALKH